MTLDKFLHGDKNIEKIIGEAYDHHDKIMDDKQGHADLYNTVVKPAHESMMSTINKKLADKDLFGKDTDKIHKKEKEIKAVIADGLKEFFKKAKPGILDSIKDEKDPDEVYKALTHFYNTQVLKLTQEDTQKGILGLNHILELGMNDKDYTLGRLKMDLDSTTGMHKQQITDTYINRKANIKFTDVDDHDVAKYVHKKLTDRNLSVDKIGSFYTHNIETLNKIRSTAVNNNSLKQYDISEVKKPKK